MKKPDEYEILERAHQAAGAHMMQKSPRADELIACLEGEIAKRDARIVELERYRFAFNEWHDKTEWVQAESATLSAKYLGCHRADVMRSLIDDLREELAACRVAVENCEVFRARIAELEADRDRIKTIADNYSALNMDAQAELAALREQKPIKLHNDVREYLRDGIDSATHCEEGDVDYEFANGLGILLGKLYAAPVSEAKAQGVVMPPSPYMPGSQPTDFTDYELGEIHGQIAMWEEVKRLNAAPVQQVSVQDGFVLAKETVVEMPDGSKELGYTTIGRVGIFNSAEEVFDAIRELDLPLGWVSMTTEQLLPGWMLAAAPAAPAADAGHVFYGMDGNHP